jgi:hypothetical protein
MVSSFVDDPMRDRTPERVGERRPCKSLTCCFSSFPSRNHTSLSTIRQVLFLDNRLSLHSLIIQHSMAHNDHPSKHIMLSYQWDNQPLVLEIHAYLEQAQKWPVWMDTKGGMVDSLSAG